ncbi:hypothetical protein N2152v2_010107 [Parachlorella kessleri]
MSRARVVSFPAELLERITLLLSLKHRVRFCSTCKRLRQLGASSQTLWETVSWAGAGFDSYHSFAAWVSRHARQLRRLSLSLAFAPATQEDVAHITHFLLGCLNNSPLLSLSIRAFFCRLPVLAVVGQLRHLKQLRLTDFRSSNPSLLSVPKQLSLLRGLTCLDLWQRHGYALADGCLPASLLCLRIGLGAVTLPPAILAATQLQRLELRLDQKPEPSPLDCAGLDALSHLTMLGLRRCDLHSPPPQLLHLSKLMVLDLAGNRGLEAAALVPLAQLTTLRELDLSSCDLRDLPGELFRPLSLAALSLADSMNSMWLPLEVPQGLQSPQSLSTNVGAISEEGFPSLTALTHLHLSSPDEPFGTLFENFLSLPKLQRVTFDSEVARLMGSAAALDSFVTFLRSIPHVECGSLVEYVLPLASQLVRWDKVS